MNDPQWEAVDDYLANHFALSDATLAAVLAANVQAGLPSISVTPLQGRLLQFMVRMMSARAVLELGTLGGYSTIFLARGLPPGGRVVTIEADPKHAKVALANFERAGVTESVELILGRALDVLPRLEADQRGPFDFIFIDADKENYPDYLTWTLRLSRPGTVIVADNVVRGGAVANPHSTDPSVQGVQRMLDLMAANPRLQATALQTVGSKGYDGFAIGMVSG